MRKMRRTERELPQEKAKEILSKAKFGVLSTTASDGTPYGVPVNYIYQDNKLYFHCANEGHKLDNIDDNSKVCFTIVTKSEIDAKERTTHYESVIVFGTANRMQENKGDALYKLTEVLTNEDITEMKEYITSMAEDTTIVEITIEGISGKSNPKL